MTLGRTLSVDGIDWSFPGPPVVLSMYTLPLAQVFQLMWGAWMASWTWIIEYEPPKQEGGNFSDISAIKRLGNTYAMGSITLIPIEVDEFLSRSRETQYAPCGNDSLENKMDQKLRSSHKFGHVSETRYTSNAGFSLEDMSIR